MILFRGLLRDRTHVLPYWNCTYYTFMDT